MKSKSEQYVPQWKSGVCFIVPVRIFVFPYTQKRDCEFDRRPASPLNWTGPKRERSRRCILYFLSRIKRPTATYSAKDKDLESSTADVYLGATCQPSITKHGRKYWLQNGKNANFQPEPNCAQTETLQLIAGVTNTRFVSKFILNSVGSLLSNRVSIRLHDIFLTGRTIIKASKNATDPCFTIGTSLVYRYSRLHIFPVLQKEDYIPVRIRRNVKNLRR